MTTPRIAGALLVLSSACLAQNYKAEQVEDHGVTVVRLVDLANELPISLFLFSGCHLPTTLARLMSVSVTLRTKRLFLIQNDKAIRLIEPRLQCRIAVVPVS